MKAQQTQGSYLPKSNLSPAAKRAFFRMIEVWELSQKEAATLLGNPSRTTLHHWKKGQGGDLSRDQLDRVSYLLGIYKSLHILFPNAEQANTWIRRESLDLGGQTALSIMLRGSVMDLHCIRSYLDHARGH